MRWSLGFLLTAAALAGELSVPPVVEREGTVMAVYRTSPQATGKGELSVRWTDRLERLVEERRIAVVLTDETEIQFPLDLRRAVAMGNTLTVHFSFRGVNRKGVADEREEDVKADFVARPERGWNDYMIMMWQPHTAEQVAALRALGINGGQFSGRAKSPPEFLLKNDLRWYAENIATDFYSEYHRYRADRIQNWSYLEAKEHYRRHPESKEAFKRHPSLSDPEWLRRIRERLVGAARMWSPFRPVFYDLGDESGIADLAAFWDFDFSDYSLSEMRVWLRERYGTLASLNAQWGKNFANWEAVIPDSTAEVMRKPGDNFSAWADFKEWMDEAFARAVKMGVDAVRSVDPDAYVGVAGAQMPGWGGYDYARLGAAVTAIEPYNIGNNIEILRSLNPGVAVMTTSFARGPWEQHRIWYELLHGARGHIIWDEKSEFVAKDGTVGERGREVSPYYNEIRNGLGALLMNSRRLSGPVAIHYSQASMRTEWMLRQRPHGEAWVDRTSATERKDSEFLRLRESYCRLLEDLGLQYDFISYGQLEEGELLRRGYRAMILPRSSALSPREVQALREFARQGGLVIADGEPGTFDEHSRRLAGSPLAGIYQPFAALDYHQQRLMSKEGATKRAMQTLLAGAGVRPEFAVTDSAGSPVTGVETHVFRNGDVFIVGLLSNPQLRVDELGPPEFQSNAAFEKSRDVVLRLPAAMECGDVRAVKTLGRKSELTLRVTPYEPVVIACSARPIPELQVSAPARVVRGEIARIGIRLDGSSPAASHVYHVEVRDPSGNLNLIYSGNVLSSGGVGVKLLAMAVNDSRGTWTITIRELMSGQQRRLRIEAD